MVSRKLTHSHLNQANKRYLGKGVRIELMEAWISSRVLPFVSGTNRSTNTTVSPQMVAKMKNVPASISKFHKSENLQREQIVGTNVLADVAIPLVPA
jgi:hypothetical protein